jgi:hypothetical protein
MQLPHINKSFVRANKTTIAVCVFLILFFAVHQLKPAIFYTKEGGFRQFGVGYRQKTVVPIWLFAILLAILCYLAVLCYLVFG